MKIDVYIDVPSAFNVTVERRPHQ